MYYSTFIFNFFLFFLVLLTQAHKFESMLNFFNIYTYLRERERERERDIFRLTCQKLRKYHRNKNSF